MKKKYKIRFIVNLLICLCLLIFFSPNVQANPLARTIGKIFSGFTKKTIKSLSKKVTKKTIKHAPKGLTKKVVSKKGNVLKTGSSKAKAACSNSETLSSLGRNVAPRLLASSYRAFVKKEELHKNMNIIVNDVDDFTGIDYSIKKYDSPVKNQKNYPYCTAFSVVAAMENMLRQKYHKDYDLSERKLWSMYNIPCLKQAVKKGNYTINEDFWKLEEISPQIPLGIPIDKYIIDNSDTTKTYLSTILKSFKNHTPIILGYTVSYQPEETEQDGIIRAGKPTNLGHTVLISRIQKWKEHLVFEFKNSYGRSWGNDGYGYIRWDYCQKYGCVAAAIQTIQFDSIMSDNYKSYAVKDKEKNVQTEPKAKTGVFIIKLKNGAEITVDRYCLKYDFIICRVNRGEKMFGINKGDVIKITEIK